MTQSRHTLYTCYFGLREPLVQTQVVPYLRELAEGGIKVSLVTFEPDLHQNWTAEQIESRRISLAKEEIAWECLAYHKRPSAIATAYDIFAGARFIRKKVRVENVDVLHGRSHVAALMGTLARKFSKRKSKLIFDIRGFLPEEYADAGVWPENGMLFRAAKRAENWLMRESDGFVVLTEKARTILFGPGSGSHPYEGGVAAASADGVVHWDAALETPPATAGGTDLIARPVEVIPCCVDFENRFPGDLVTKTMEIAARLNVNHRFVITHVGALGGLYLTREIVDFLAAAKAVDPTTFALFLTQSDPTELISLLRQNGFGGDDFFVSKVGPNDISAYLGVAHVGLSFVKATYATQSRSPTKIPEYLAAGLPIIANAGVGDVDDLITGEGVGVLIDRFDREAYVDAIERLRSLGDMSERCRETARKRFDLKTVGGVRYRRLYDRLFCNEGR